jgi:hypothetical protein
MDFRLEILRLRLQEKKKRRKSFTAQLSVLTHRVTYKIPCKHAWPVPHVEADQSCVTSVRTADFPRLRDTLLRC